jgi:cytoskeletal protein CcmA (bactofilin family)
MSLFRPDAPPSRPQPRDPAVPPGTRRAATLLAVDTRFAGTLTGSSELVVEGELEGAIDIEGTVIIAPSGRVRGEVHGRSVQVGGKVWGNVRGRERVELTPSASLEGDIAAPRVVVAEGAYFKGRVEMVTEATAGKGDGEAKDDAKAKGGDGKGRPSTAAAGSGKEAK